MKAGLEEITLQGNIVNLIPIKREYKNALLEAASDGKLWELWFTSVPSKENIDDYLDKIFKDQESKDAFAFVVFHKKTQSIIGTTRYCNIDLQNKRLEIGYTWYAQSYQKTGVNTECKFLLLRHAFENLSCIAVEFRTHWFNQKSREAILRLGAKQDGVLRNHQFDKTDNLRDTVVFSIIESEWKTVKASLEYKMERYSN